MSLVAVVGLAREARIIEKSNARVIVGGGREDSLRAALATALDPDTTDGVISIGIAGALAADLAVGGCVVANAVIVDGASLACDSAWMSRLLSALPEARVGAILHASEPVLRAADKRAAATRTQAIAVDMESGLAAREAHARAIPFAALRIISDGADDTLPPAAQVAMRPDGGVDLAAVLGSIAGNPGQIPALIRTGRNAGRAFATLTRCADLLGVGLACPYLG